MSTSWVDRTALLHGIARMADQVWGRFGALRIGALESARHVTAGVAEPAFADLATAKGAGSLVG